MGGASLRASADRGGRWAAGPLLSVEHVRGRDGIEMAQPGASIFTLEDGEITRWQGFWNRESALKAAGLAE